MPTTPVRLINLHHVDWPAVENPILKAGLRVMHHIRSKEIAMTIAEKLKEEGLEQGERIGIENGITPQNDSAKR